MVGLFLVALLNACRFTNLFTGIPKLEDDECQIFGYSALDRESFENVVSIQNTTQLIGYRMKNAQVWKDSAGQFSRFGLSNACINSLQQQGLLGSTISSFGTQLKFQETQKNTLESCTKVSGSWFLVKDHLHRKPHNFFDELSTEWYHIWLAKMELLKSISSPVFLTHLSGNNNSTSKKFQVVYEVLGNYVEWDEIGTLGSNETHPTCIEFEDAITLSTGWLWMIQPLTKYENHPLQAFTNIVRKAMHIGEDYSDETLRAALAARGPGSRHARNILNEEEVLQSMVSLLPEYKIHHVDFAQSSLHEAASLMRLIRIFVFPHGGAGPNVLWMNPGAVAIELFPMEMADPMYRNLAVLTGKSYISWQAQTFTEPNSSVWSTYTKNSYHFCNQSSFTVQIQEFSQIILAAAMVERGSSGASWSPANAKSFTTQLTPWSDHRNRLVKHVYTAFSSKWTF